MPNEQRLHIAVVVRHFVTTGAERYAVEVTQRLAKKHKITLLCQTYDPNLVEGLNVTTIQPSFNKPSWLNLKSFGNKVEQTLIDLKPDLVHSHDRLTQFNGLVVHCPCYKTKFVEAGDSGLVSTPDENSIVCVTGFTAGLKLSNSKSKKRQGYHRCLQLHR